MPLLKSIAGIPDPLFPVPPGVVLADEARTARRRFYPVTILFTTYSLSVIGLAFATHPAYAALFLALGIAFWTLLEYLVHRFILHGRFPDGEGLLKHRVHTFFDTMHADHHQRPWDGMYINGYLDSIPFAALFVAVSFLLTPFYKAPVLVAGLLQSYVLEEWIHYSVHFCRFKGRYFQYIRLHHWYHHSPHGSSRGFGLTSGLWDRISGTRLPPRRSGPGRPREIPEELWRRPPAEMRP